VAGRALHSAALLNFPSGITNFGVAFLTLFGAQILGCSRHHHENPSSAGSTSKGKSVMSLYKAT